MSINELKEISDAIKFNNKRIYTVKEVSEILQTTVARVSELINKGLLISLKLGDRKVTSKHLDKFIEEYDGKDVNEILENL